MSQTVAEVIVETLQAAGVFLPRSPRVRAWHDEVMALLQARLDPAELEAAWADGSTMTASEYVEEALDALSIHL